MMWEIRGKRFRGINRRHASAGKAVGTDLLFSDKESVKKLSAPNEGADSYAVGNFSCRL